MLEIGATRTVVGGAEAERSLSRSGVPDLQWFGLERLSVIALSRKWWVTVLSAALSPIGTGQTPNCIAQSQDFSSFGPMNVDGEEDLNFGRDFLDLFQICVVRAVSSV